VYELDNQKILREEDSRLGGKDPYASSKVCVEFLVKAWPMRHDIGIATARSGNVIGGGDWAKDRLIPDIIRSAFSQNSLEVRLPHAVRPWQHVIEPLYGYLLLAECIFSGLSEISTMNFGPSSQNQVCVQDIIDFSMAHLPEDKKFSSDHKVASYQESDYLLLNSEFAKQNLNWIPVLSWQEAVALSLNWYLDFEREIPVSQLMERDIQYFLNRLED
jgi:CDP-glucose 4,6-dehydratase